MLSCWSAWDEVINGFRFTSTKSSCFVQETASFPCNADVILQNKGCTQKQQQLLVKEMFISHRLVCFCFVYLNVESNFGTSLHEQSSKLTSFIITFLYWNLPVVEYQSHHITIHVFLLWKKLSFDFHKVWFVYLLLTRSVLLPTRTIMTWLPLSARTSSIHFEVFKNDCLSAHIRVTTIVRSSEEDEHDLV